MKYYCFEHVHRDEVSIPKYSLITLSNDNEPLIQLDIYDNSDNQENSTTKIICLEGENMQCKEVDDYMSYINKNATLPQHIRQINISDEMLETVKAYLPKCIKSINE